MHTLDKLIKESQNPLVSVYIPTRNRPNLLIRAIDSVLKQTYQNIELIIINDNSTDETKEILDKLCEVNKNFKVINFDKNKGACEARNCGIVSANGKFITGLDDDDFYNDESRIEKLVRFWFTKPEYSKKVIFDDVLVKTKFGTLKITKNKIITEKLLRTNNTVGSQIFALRETYITCGLFDSLMPAWQDWDLYYRIAQKGYTFINIQTNSYTVDKSHLFNRISDNNEKYIRFAMNRFVKKIDCITNFEKTQILILALNYPNVRIRLSEIKDLINNHQIIFLFKYPILKLLYYLGMRTKK